MYSIYCFVQQDFVRFLLVCVGEPKVRGHPTEGKARPPAARPLPAAAGEEGNRFALISFLRETNASRSRVFLQHRHNRRVYHLQKASLGDITCKRA